MTNIFPDPSRVRIYNGVSFFPTIGIKGILYIDDSIIPNSVYTWDGVQYELIQVGYAINAGYAYSSGDAGLVSDTISVPTTIPLGKIMIVAGDFTIASDLTILGTLAVL